MINRIRMTRKAPAYPKLMRRIGVLPKLSETELRAIAYADAARNLETGRVLRKSKRKATQ